MVPTAEKFIKTYKYDWTQDNNTLLSECMVEFAKLHVKAALKVASKLDFESIEHPEANDYEEAVKMTIEECYPETLIK